MLCLCGAKPTAPQPSRQVVYEETAKPANLRHAKTAPEGSEASEDIDEDAEDFTESLLDISLRKDRELVLISGSLPDMKRDSAAIALDYKGVKFIEEMIEEGELPHYLRDAFEGATLPFLAWKSNGLYSSACRADLRGAFKFIEDQVAFPRLFLPSCLVDIRLLGRLGLNTIEPPLEQLLRCQKPLAMREMRHTVLEGLRQLDVSLKKTEKYGGPFVFGNGITVVDVIFAPIVQRIRIAQQIRGLAIPAELAHLSKYMVTLFENSTTLADHLAADRFLIAHYERMAVKGMQDVLPMHLQAKCIRRHIKSCGIFAQNKAKMMEDDSVTSNFVRKLIRVEALIIVHYAYLQRCLKPLNNRTTASFIASTVEAGKSTADEIADIVLLVKALSVEGNKDAKAEQLGVVMEKLKMLETAFTLRQVLHDQTCSSCISHVETEEARRATQRCFFGFDGSSAFDPWVDLTTFVIEGLTADETELYLWQAYRSMGSSSFLDLVARVDAAVAANVIQAGPWNAVLDVVMRRAGATQEVAGDIDHPTAPTTGTGKARRKSITMRQPTRGLNASASL